MSVTDRLYRRIQMMVAPTTITATNDTGPVHRVQVKVTPRETIDDVPVLQLYGVTSHAQPGSNGLALFCAGDRSNPVIIATGNQAARMRNIQPGEVALYTDEGDYVKLARGKIVEVQSGSELRVTAPLVTINATNKVRMVTPRLEVTGDIIDHCDTQSHTAANMRQIYNTHTHPNVQSGPANTGVPNQQQRAADE